MEGKLQEREATREGRQGGGEGGGRGWKLTAELLEWLGYLWRFSKNHFVLHSSYSHYD